MKPVLMMVLGLLLLGAVLIVALDIVFYFKYGRPGTISAEVLALARLQPILPLVVGLLVGLVLGHLFWSQ